ncbi:MAG TPA: 6-phosphofructokinase, partial [Rhizomicrobium sp.]|nr:6-phosphofructokinase [Rhizomicrobium sp.]
AGVALEARRAPNIQAVYGAFHGVRGIVNQDFVDLGKESEQTLLEVADTPSAALGSTRDKPDRKYCEEIFRSVRAHGIGAFFYIGGNDSADTVRIVSEFARTAGYPLRCVHVPKTIDNDLTVNDHTPGFPSAARFVAQAFMGADLDNESLPGVYLGVVMGRHAGFLTAAAALGRTGPDSGPHLIYLPERPFNLDGFFRDVKANMDRHGRCVVAVSEGIADAQGAAIATTLASHVQKDAHGNVELGGGALADYLGKAIKDTLGLKRVRGDTFGYLQRSFAGCVSDVDQREAREAGQKGLQFALNQDRDGSVTIRRAASGPYAVRYEFTALEELAAKTRHMPDAFIAPSGNHVTEAFRDYLTPLLGSGMPKIRRLARHPVPAIAAGPP